MTPLAHRPDPYTIWRRATDEAPADERDEYRVWWTRLRFIELLVITGWLPTAAINVDSCRVAVVEAALQNLVICPTCNKDGTTLCARGCTTCYGRRFVSPDFARG
jgi:hypothetical protein